ncbi:MAG TPA: hypothetical protein VN759_13215 [Pseudolysinimonas sp.]|nr:hypothetical protein [Pseudolysinimonas sp.]
MTDRRRRRPEPVVALFVAVTWAAVVFAIDGLLSVLLNRDPIPAHVTPYYGLAAMALAGIVVWTALTVIPRAASPWLGALTAAAAVYLLLVASALPVGLRLIAAQSLSPFVACAAVFAALAVVGMWVGVRRWRSV